MGEENVMRLSMLTSSHEEHCVGGAFSETHPALEAWIEALILSGIELASTHDLVRWIEKRASSLGQSAAYQDITPHLIDHAIDALNAKFARENRPYEIVETSKGWKHFLKAEWAPWIQANEEGARPSKLSPSALETLAVIAYRQPVTKSEIERIRGVSADGMVNVLLEKQLIQPVGRAETAGKPWLYGTTEYFLELFGIVKLEDLPNAQQLTQRLEKLYSEN